MITHEEAIKIGLWGNKIIELSEKLEEFLKENFSLDNLPERKDFINTREKKQFPMVLPESTLSNTIKKEIKAIKDLEFTELPLERLKYSIGKSYYELIKIRNAKVTDIVDGVVRPLTITALREFLSFANKHKIIVVPTAGKTSVTEALTPTKQSLALDVLKLNKIINFYPESLLIEVEGGILLPDLEKWLSGKGYKLGHSPQSFMYSTVGGSIASRGSGQFSSHFGSMRHMVHSLTVETPIGTFTERKNIVPESAVGPSLSELFIGSEASLGIISKAMLRIKPIQEQLFKAFLFKSFQEGIRAIQEFYQAGHHPATIRLSDEEETELLLLSSTSTTNATIKDKLFKKIGKYYLEQKGFITNHRCLLILQLEGDEEINNVSMNKITSLCKKYQAVSLGKTPAKVWYDQRYELPYMRENILQLGILVDTVETSATFDKLFETYTSTIKCLKQICPIAMAHVSHVYPEGASLYFTFMVEDDFNWKDPVITKIRKVVAENFINHSTISHHHGVGKAYKEFIHKERSEIENELLVTIKNKLDPNGILNPSSGLIYNLGSK